VKSEKKNSEKTHSTCSSFLIWHLMLVKYFSCGRRGKKKKEREEKTALQNRKRKSIVLQNRQKLQMTT